MALSWFGRRVPSGKTNLSSVSSRLLRLFVELIKMPYLASGGRDEEAGAYFPKDVPINTSFSHTLPAKAFPPLIERLMLFSAPVAAK